MSDDPLAKRRDTRTPAASCISGCGWVEIQHYLHFVDDEGQTIPAAGVRYRLHLPQGGILSGVLDDNGYAGHEGIGFGTVRVEVEPYIDVEKQIILKDIRKAMDEFIAVELKEKQALTDNMQNKTNLEEDWEYTKAVGRGARNVAVSTLEGAVDLSINVGKEALHLLGYFNPLTAPQSFERDVARTKQAKKELQAIADVDWKRYAALMNDDDTQQLFNQFANDYLDAQHGLEITEGSSEVITVILGVVAIKAAAAISTTGTGTSKLAQLGDRLADSIQRLTKVLERAQAKAEFKSEGNQRIMSRLDIRNNSPSNVKSGGGDGTGGHPPSSGTPNAGLHNRADLTPDAKQDSFKTVRKIDMDNLSEVDAAITLELIRQGKADDQIEQLLSSGDNFTTQQLKPGDKLYGFDSQSNKYGAKKQDSMYWLDEEGYQAIKKDYYRDGTWDKEGLKNNLALPCMNRADVIDTVNVTEPQSAIKSTVGKAHEQLSYTNDDYTTGMIGKIMPGGGTQITPDPAKITGTVTRLKGTP